MEEQKVIAKHHIAEALSYRQLPIKGCALPHLKI
jgi:hypothetical protein